MDDPLDALMRRAESDDDLRRELASAATAEDIARIAGRAGIALAVADVRVDGQLDEAELESVSGGTMLHPTMSVFCGTNGSFCTFNPYACQSPG